MLIDMMNKKVTRVKAKKAYGGGLESGRERAKGDAGVSSRGEAQEYNNLPILNLAKTEDKRERHGTSALIIFF